MILEIIFMVGTTLTLRNVDDVQECILTGTCSHRFIYCIYLKGKPKLEKIVEEEQLLLNDE